MGREPGATRAVILVEGLSDCRALETLARRRGRDLPSEGVRVVPMGGATNVGRFLERFGPHGLDLRLAGLCDAAEQRHFLRALERAGLGRGLTRRDMEDLGFHVCDRDLEDELIRTLGVAAVEELIAAQGEAHALRTFTKQPAQRDVARADQLRRFLGTKAGRKARYAPLLVEATIPGGEPRPLREVLARA